MPSLSEGKNVHKNNKKIMFLVLQGSHETLKSVKKKTKINMTALKAQHSLQQAL